MEQHFLIIISRHRPELAHEFEVRYGHEHKVILDRRREPRPALPEPGQTLPPVWRAQLEEIGFMLVPVG